MTITRLTRTVKDNINMDIKDLKKYVISKRKTIAKQSAEQIAIHGNCQPLTDKEYIKYKDIIIVGKRNHKIKFTHNKIWRE